MIDWRESMQQSYEFYTVDPSTWKDSKPINCVKSCTINRDKSNDTLGSATIDTSEPLGECYIRAYLVVRQNGVTERVPLGTFLIQTPGESFDGKVSSYSMDAYTPLIELKGTLPPIGYSILEGTEILPVAAALCRENMRAPIITSDISDDTMIRVDIGEDGKPEGVLVPISPANPGEYNEYKNLNSDFVSNLDDTWFSFISDLLSAAKLEFGFDEFSRVIFEPIRDIGSLQHVWTYSDDDVSILLPEFTNNRDLYGIPNVVEVVYSTGTAYKTARVVNDDPNSPISTVNRGREVVHRESNPNFGGIPTQGMIDDYAEQLLRNLSCLEHTISYSHGYCPVGLNDCVMLNIKKAGLTNVKARVISQSISCETGCRVSETAVYTTKLWR